MIICWNWTVILLFESQWRGSWMLMPPSLIWVLPLWAFTGQYKYNTSKNPFSTFSLKSLSYHLRQTFQFLCNLPECHLAVRCLYTLLLDVGSVTQSDVADRDAQRPSPVTGDVSCDHITILSSVAYSTSLCYQEVSVCVNISHISLTTSATRQILCPQSGSLYLGRLLHFSQAQFIHPRLPVSCCYNRNEQNCLLCKRQVY